VGSRSKQRGRKSSGDYGGGSPFTAEDPSPFTVEGEIEQYGRFFRGARRTKGWRRAAGWFVIVVCIVGPLLGALFQFFQMVFIFVRQSW
jgi:hypothetical protein